jgi:uncharacterized protein
MTVLGLLLAASIGLSLGVMGAGGSILTVPIFVYVLGFGVKEAVASSLAVVGVTSLFGAVEHRREGHVRLRLALNFGVLSMAGAYLGSRLASLLSGTAQLFLFAAVMLVVAVFMFRNDGPDKEEDEPGGGPVARTSLALLALGAAVGVLTGLVGVGGGFLIVPALVLLAGIPMKEAVGTSLLVIAMNSTAGFVGYLGSVEIQWAFVAAFAALAVGGSFVGTYLARFVAGWALKRSFAVFLVLMAGFIFYENIGATPLP